MKTFVLKASQPPPVMTTGIQGWLRQNLFSSPLNIGLTILFLALFAYLIPPALNWLFFNADWLGETRAACDSGGACWVFIRKRFLQIMFGLFYGANPDQIWRPLLALGLLVALATPLFMEKTRFKFPIALFLIVVFPFIGYALIHGSWLGLKVAETSAWGGFMLTFILAGVGIVGALPIGILLALGRRSQMPVIHSISVVYIEFWRGAPLITILFMASNMLPLFFPSEVDFDKVARALIGITLFKSAYVAEAVRGGLQAIPKGQFEAADALGLGYWQKMIFIVLPQALKISIPGMVNSFIELFKDTSLVAIIGLLDLLRMAEIASRSLEWKGFELEAYIFAAAIFWICCWGMSHYSQRLERKLDTGHSALNRR